MAARHLFIHGSVQGVGYRDALCREAERLGVTGWVRNCSDGTVEAQAQGAPEALDALVAWSRRGPALARVDDVRVSDAVEDPASAGFRRLPTA